MTTPPPLVPPAVRLRLGTRPGHGDAVRRIDGAWWPRSYDLTAELPALLAALPPGWGNVTSVLVNGAMWSLSDDGAPVGGQQVHLRRAEASRAEDTVCLVTPGRGRWDLVVVPPAATAEEAERLMETAAAEAPLTFPPTRSGG
ncbi:hypothetical protein AQJ30_35910 [Streptomyces longwoodensis]|uniref:Uncharacterized protein n=1 Tax=Streptomyces longwoodensis TaxID=68231 RepID=A0A101QNB1_9ACTN|nr:DUF5994 family protein [Streptomyces longwoodensis]KUN33065.1 hypothetical protein AQJ30_35910 [Streptomyces longwoodensis]